MNAYRKCVYCLEVFMRINVLPSRRRNCWVVLCRCVVESFWLEMCVKVILFAKKEDSYIPIGGYTVIYIYIECILNIFHVKFCCGIGIG